MRTAALVVVVAVALAAGVTTIAGRGGDPELELSQRQIQQVSRAAVERLVGTAPDPRGRSRPKGRASCRPGRSDDLRNPWDCTIVYPPAFRTRYRVMISPDGSYTGRRLDTPGRLRGCCLALANVG